MNSLIETLNQFGGQFLHFAWPMLWQSSLLIAFIFALDMLLARKIRASIRYGLWMVVLVKLLLPPTLALPTGAAWWLTQAKPAINAPIAPHYVVTYGKTTQQPDLAPHTIPIPEAASAPLSSAGWALLVSCAVSLALLLWLTKNWWQVTRKVRGANASDELADALANARSLVGLRSCVRLKVVEDRMSPAVCGLIGPVILLPRTLLDNISAAQLRAVLLHELFHLRRRDVWVNCAQAFLQMAYWWHPLLWFANARIRRVREEAVDDAVMLALREDAETYAPTLLEVAKLAFQRPLMSLGLVGIMESRSALRQRIERLVDFHAPRKAGLTFASLFGIFVFSAVALPMGKAPTPAAKQIPSAAMPGQPQPTARKTQSDIVLINAQIYKMRATDFEQMTSTLILKKGVETNSPWWSASRKKFGELLKKLDSSGPQSTSRRRIQTSSGVPATIHVGYGTTSFELACSPFVKGSNIDLAIQGRVVEALTKGGVTNQFNANASAEDQGGIVIRNNPLRGSEPGKLIVVVIGVQIMMDGASKNATAMKFRLDTGVPQERLNQLMRESGVKTPPTSFLYLDNGFMFARGTGEQLALVNSVAQKLHGYAIEGSVSTPTTDSVSTNLYSRQFKVDPNTFLSNLQRMDHAGAYNVTTTNSPAAVSAMVRKFMVDLLSIDLNSPAGKSVFFNDRNGLLLVRSTLSDLDAIEQALTSLNYTPPQINITGRFAEVPENFFNSGTGNPLPAGMTNGTGILTDAEARTLIQRLKAQPGVDVLAMPNVTTLAGRQVQIRATQFVTALTNSVPAKNKSDSSITATMQTGKIETGPVLDVIAELLADGFTIDLRTIASVTEFLGYADGTNMAPQTVTNSMPAVRLRTKAAHCQLYEGQTQVLFPKTEQVISGAPDKKRDARVADYIRQVEKKDGKKILVVFVTPTLRDPAAKRVYWEEDLPAASNKFPKPKR
jgi:beta-lactamase regulating signal transducer with metallopeptidase domain